MSLPLPARGSVAFGLAPLVTAHLGSAALLCGRGESRAWEGRKKAVRETSCVWTGCRGQLSGRAGCLSGGWGPTDPAYPESKDDSSLRYHSCNFRYFNPSFSGSGIQTNKTHHAGQAQPSLHIHSASLKRTVLLCSSCPFLLPSFTKHQTSASFRIKGCWG